MAQVDDPGVPIPDKAFKYIGDLDALIQAVLKAMPQTKPWQRHLRQHFADIERCVQVLRMTLVMKRSVEERAHAKEQLRVALRVARQYAATGRADAGTKTAVQLATDLGVLIFAAVPDFDSPTVS